MKRLNEYEIELKKTTKSRYQTHESEYGFEGNPPIVIHARNKTEAKKQLKLPKNVKIKRITRIYKWK